MTGAQQLVDGGFVLIVLALPVIWMPFVRQLRAFGSAPDGLEDWQRTYLRVARVLTIGEVAFPLAGICLIALGLVLEAN